MCPIGCPICIPYWVFVVLTGLGITGRKAFFISTSIFAVLVYFVGYKGIMWAIHHMTMYQIGISIAIWVACLTCAYFIRRRKKCCSQH